MKEAKKSPEVLSVDVYNRWWNSGRTPENFKAFCREVGEYINAKIAEKCGNFNEQSRCDRKAIKQYCGVLRRIRELRQCKSFLGRSPAQVADFIEHGKREKGGWR